MHSKEEEDYGDKDSNDYGYWFNELDSLGIHPKRKNELNDSKEMQDLVENMKQTMLQEYRSAYE
ncbi:MAG TPA: hypothetical protein VNI77_09495 [Nitrososphaera sp.]|nr:hypothetical protein [Nitrososphaera sp.]